MTRERFTQAVAQLQAQGLAITRNSVLRAAGGGSKSHASRYLQEWREARNVQYSPETHTQATPETLLDDAERMIHIMDELAPALAAVQAVDEMLTHPQDVDEMLTHPQDVDEMLTHPQDVDALVPPAPPLLAAKRDFEQALANVVAHEQVRPRQATGLAWSTWYGTATQLRTLCGQAEQRWRTLDEEAKTALQLLHVSTSRYSQGRPRSGQHKVAAEQAEKDLLALVGPLADSQTLLEAVRLALQPPQVDGKALLPPLV